MVQRYGALQVLAGMLLLAAAAEAQAPVFHYERSSGLETPRLAETVEDARALATASPWVRVTTFGRSPQGRELPLVIVDNDRGFDPAVARARGKAVVMIQAGIHPGEPEGKDAGLLFLRDVLQAGSPLLDRLVFLFIPVFNVDGHERFSAWTRINQNGPKEAGWRSTAAGLNLNRDYLKADTPEMRAWLKLYQAWLPDVFVDCHTTDGADYQYALTYGEEVGKDSTWFVEPALGSWIRDTFLPGFRAGMEKDGILVTQYVSFRSWHDPRSGLTGWPASPRYSNGYQSAQNRIGLLLETHMLKPYAVRVEATRSALRAVSEIAARERDALLKLNREADAATSSAAFRQAPMALAFEDDGSSEPVEFKGYEYRSTKSELTGGEWLTYDRGRPVTFELPRFQHMKVTASARVPEGYVVPAEWGELIARLDAQGIAYHRLAVPRTLTVASYRLLQAAFGRRPREGRQTVEKVSMVDLEESRTFPAGSAVVPTSQRTARLLVHLLEPASPDSLLSWGFFNTIFEQKEYGESYVLEPLAREMLAKDPQLKATFEKRRSEDMAFAASPEAQLNWFYQRSQWGDPSLNVYPVGKLLDPQLVRELLQ
jgi:hypothetical protein